MTLQFSAKEKLFKGLLVFEPSGDIDVYSAPQLQNAVEKALGRHPAHVILNLSLVSYMDSTGIRLLAGLVERLEALQKKLAVVAPPPQVRRVLDMSGVAKRIFCLVEREADAVAALGGQAAS